MRTRAPLCSSTGNSWAARCGSRVTSIGSRSRSPMPTSPRGPRGAQLAAAASHQSSVLRDSRRDPIHASAELAREHEGSDVRRPDHWGGYPPRSGDLRVPGSTATIRMHDRLRYRRDQRASGSSSGFRPRARRARRARPHPLSSADARGPSGPERVCSGRRGPTTTAVTHGCASSHASASVAESTPRRSAISANRSRAAKVSGRRRCS